MRGARLANLPFDPDSFVCGNATFGCAHQLVPELLRICTLATRQALLRFSARAAPRERQPQAASGNSRLMENFGEAIDVHMANARSGEQTFCERIAHLVTHPGMLAGNSIVEGRPRGCPGWAAGAHRQAHVQELNTGSPGSEALVTWSAEQNYWRWPRRCQPCGRSGTNHGT